ncbi:MAG: hypothetical protein Q7T55_22665, partial [Solirubrobacteraceae bacterium]|nr:hypothetical protein [Solirubrobacteraceae bacterium]
ALGADAIPIAEGVASVAGALGRDPLVFAQSSGEDFALLVTVPPELRGDAEEAGVVAWIGRVEALAEGAAPAVTGLPADPSGRAGHDHRA